LVVNLTSSVIGCDRGSDPTVESAAMDQFDHWLAGYPVQARAESASDEMLDV
jgi:hypothetical protein